MSKNKGLGLVSALAVGAGVAAVAAGKKYKTAETKKKEDYDALHNTSEYRNTERGKYEKNSKGIYYTNGNYEAFARPPRITYPRLGSKIPSHAPPAISIASRMWIFFPGICPSRTRKQAAAREASPLPTI